MTDHKPEPHTRPAAVALDGDSTHDSAGSPAGGAPGDQTGETTTSRSRRWLLETLAVGGGLAVAGCGQRSAEDSSASTGRPTVTVTGTARGGGGTFRTPIDQNPARTSVYLTLSLASLLPAAFGTTVIDNASIPLRRFVMQPGVWTDGLWAGADVHYTWLADPITASSTEVSVEIPEDARWSDGHPVTGRDIALDPLQRHLRKFFPPYYATEDRTPPDNVFGAFDDVEIADRSVTYRSEAGHFDRFWDLTLRTQLAAFNHYDRSSRCLPTHVEPYRSFADAVIETVDRAQRGEIDPWDRQKPWKRTPGASEAPSRTSLARTHLGKKRYVEKFATAGNVLATGAWDPVEFGETTFVFEPNPHHYNADRLNFERVIFEYTPSLERRRAGVAADRFDYAAGVTPSAVVDTFPAHVTELRVPGGLATGNGLGIQFDHPALGKRAVRAALMYALDQPSIAANVHRTAAQPVETPGGDCWDATEYASRDWIDGNLTTYATDRDRAAALMREAGYARDGNQWIAAGGGGETGDALTLTLATNSDTPRWEPAVASQLSEFGIETAVKALDDSTFAHEVENGKYPLWSHWGVATNLAPVTLLIWFYAPGQREKYGIYPDEQYGRGAFTSTGEPRPRTEERWRVFTIEAPPVGRPDGPLEPYHPSSLALLYATNPPEGEFRRRVKIGMWLANWFLPTIPINGKLQQHFIDDAHWRWPKGSQSWENFASVGPRTMEGMLADGTVRANIDDPERET